MSFISKLFSRKSSKKSKTNQSKKRTLKVKTTIFDDLNNEYPTPFDNDNILVVESFYDDNDYISEKNLIKMLKNNNNYKLTSNQKKKLKKYIEEQYALNQISNNDLTLYKNIYPAFMDELKKIYKQKKKHSTIYIPKSTTLNKKLLPIRHTSKYKKKPKSKKDKKKHKSL